jgi:hypothetical protein
MPVPPLRASRSYVALEAVEAASGGPHAAVWVRADLARGAAGPEEHRIDAFQLRNEASFINDFRDNVARPDAAAAARRRPNCAVVTVIVGGRVHALVWATRRIAAGREAPAPGAPSAAGDPGPPRILSLHRPRGVRCLLSLV